MGLVDLLKRLNAYVSEVLSTEPPSSNSKSQQIQSAESNKKPLVKDKSHFFDSSYKQTPSSDKPIEIQVDIKIDNVRRPELPLSQQLSSSPKKHSSCWIPPGETISIAGKNIAGGMLYVGKHIDSSHPGYARNEPALINPGLPIQVNAPDSAGHTMGYWPHYDSISPQARAAYLDWLSQGRKDPNAYIGYVFLFFYGLERRLLDEMQRKAVDEKEVHAIYQEVKRLLSIYRNGSFQHYANDFLNAISLLYSIPIECSPDNLNASYGDFPLALKIALGRCAVQEKPIPGTLAFLWASYMQSWGTAFQRCKSIVHQLFLARYTKHYGQGLLVKPNKTGIKFSYMPANDSLPSPMDIPCDGLPNITVLSGYPVNGVHELLKECVQDLEAYSRYLGRNPDATESLRAKALLPKEVLNHDNVLTKLLNFCQEQLIQQPQALLTYSALQAVVPFPISDKPDKAESIALVQLLEKLGIGLEPDIRFGTGKLQADEKIVIFAQPEDGPTEPTATYSTALNMLHLAVMVSASDGHIAQEERALFRSHLESMLDLTIPEKARLLASCVWLETVSNHSPSSFKKRLETLNIEARRELAQFLISIANADGRIDPAEIKMLKKIYAVLGLDAEKVYSDIHAQQTHDNGPVLVKEGEPNPGYKIPQSSLPPKAAEPAFKLDLTLIEKKLQQTHEVQSMLQSIFTEDIELVDTPVAQKVDEAPMLSVEAVVFQGFDAKYSALLRELFTQSSWFRHQFEKLCQKYAFMPEGALEHINDTCFELYDDSLLEDDDDTIQLNPDLLKEFMS